MHFVPLAVAALLGDVAPNFPGTPYTMPRPLTFCIAGSALAVAVLLVIWAQVRRQSRGAGVSAVALLLVVVLTGAAMSMSHRAHSRRRYGPVPRLPVRNNAEDELLPPIEEPLEPSTGRTD